MEKKKCLIEIDQLVIDVLSIAKSQEAAKGYTTTHTKCQIQVGLSEGIRVLHRPPASHSSTPSEGSGGDRYAPRAMEMDRFRDVLSRREQLDDYHRKKMSQSEWADKGLITVVIKYALSEAADAVQLCKDLYPNDWS